MGENNFYLFSKNRFLFHFDFNNLKHKIMTKRDYEFLKTPTKQDSKFSKIHFPPTFFTFFFFFK